ncbi:hypothetical protein PVAP13_4NG236271 [Panicum virgatum]|uniref:Uncharacterized protein n=1 Tax=Panicum virgatum TaxID=38727 RepID=A0A8T0T2R4_PANVG|nr:hypothetical protein PVAP13_4NG236271 [Panicum virgatum]
MSYTACTIFFIGSVATGELNFTSTEHLAPAANALVAAPQPPPAPLPPAAALSERSARSASFTSLDGPDITSAHNEAQSAHSNQDFVEGASGRRKRKQSHIGSAIEDYVQYKKKQTGKTIEALEERKKKEEAFSVPKCLDEMDAMDGLTDVEKSYGMDIFKFEIDREDEHEKQKCSIYLAQVPD